MISLTEIAARKIVEIQTEDGLTGKPLRVRVVGGGCSGFTYDIFFEDGEPSDMDEVGVVRGVTVFIDPLSTQYLEDTEIDYVDDPLKGSGFKFLNPSVKGTCGCGSSFSA